MATKPPAKPPVVRKRPIYHLTLDPAGVDRMLELAAELDPPQTRLSAVIDHAVASHISALKKILKK